MQSVHHVVPFVHSSHFCGLFPYLQEEWLLVGVVPMTSPNLATAFADHLRHMFRANVRP